MAPRPPTEFNLIQGTNGAPLYLGAIVSTGAAQNNETTATKFYTTSITPGGLPLVLSNTLAGKVLLLQPTAAGLIMTSASPNMTINGVPGQLIIAQQSVLPPVAGTAPGVALASGERVVVTMLPTEGWLQWLPLSGSANLLVWELR